MTLGEIIANLDHLDDDYTIYAREPWALDSIAMIAIEPEDDDGDWVPDEAEELELEYLLWIHLARDVIEALEEHHGRELSLEEKLHHVVYYSINDAYDFGREPGEEGSDRYGHK